VGYTEDELWRLLGQAREMPFGAGQIALVEQVIQHADVVGDGRLSFAARMVATTAYTYGGEPAKAFVTFSWCLNEYDRDPSQRSRNDERTLLWDFKSIASALTKFPEVPLSRTYAVIDDMERRYRAGGHSLHAVYRRRWGVAHNIGDAGVAQEWYERWDAAPRDQNSDCEGCDPSAKINHLTVLGRDEEAVALAEPVLSGQLTCSEQPQTILTDLLLPYLRTGRLTEAADAHRRAYRLMRGNLSDLAGIAEHLAFCALTGNEVRGLEIVQRHLGWLDRAPSPFAAMWFAATAARVLDGLVVAGHADLTVHRRATGDRATGDGTAGERATGDGTAGDRAARDGGAGDRAARDGGVDVPVGELAAELAGRARALAARFDARNGTAWVGGQIAAALAAEPIVDHLPLSAVDRRSRALAGRSATAQATGTAIPASGAPVAPPVGGTAGRTAGGAVGRTARGPVAYPDSPAELLELAERLFREHRTAPAQAAWDHFDQRYPAGELTPLLAARRLDGRGLVAADADRYADAESTWREAADGYAAVGDEARRQVTLSRLGLLLCRIGRYDEGAAMVEAATRELLEHGDAEQRAGAELRLAFTLGLGQRPAEALAAAERAAGHIATVPGDGCEPVLAAEVAMRRAQFLLVLGRPQEAAAAATAARELLAAAGDPPVAAVAWLLYAHSLADLAEFAGAAIAFGAVLERSTEPDVVLSAQHGRGRALLAAGEPGMAIDALVEAVAGFVAAGDDAAAAFARVDLATAYQRSGQALDAAEAAEEALPVLERLGAQDAADRCRYLLSLAYRGLDQPDEALRLLDELVANLDGYDNLPGRSQMHEEAGQILYRRDRDAAAAHRFASAADGYREAGLVMDEVRARRWAALALRWADEPDQAMVTLLTAEERAGELPPGEPSTTWEQAMLAFDGARVHIGAGRLDEALSRSAIAGDGFRSIGAFGEALQADLLHAELLLRLDRGADAEPVLRAVLATAPVDSPSVENGAWLLSEVLEALGRAEEAADVRKEYGITDA
jgi:tetratricopeptide (TPR) repeat protein